MNSIHFKKLFTYGKEKNKQGGGIDLFIYLSNPQMV